MTHELKPLRTEEQVPAEDSQKARNAKLITTLIFAAALVTLAFVTFLSWQLRAWQMYAVVALVIVIVALTFSGLRLVRGGRIRLGMLITLSGSQLGFALVTLFIADLGLIIGLALPVMGYFYTSQTMRSKDVRRILVGNIVLGILVAATDFLNLDYRLQVPAIQTFIPYLVTVILLVGGFFLVRWIISGTIRAKLVTSFIVIISFSIVVVSIFTVITAQNALQEQIGTSAVEFADAQLNLVENFFLEKVSTISALAVDEKLRNALVERNLSYTGSPEEIQDQIDALDNQWRTASDFDPLVVSILSTDPQVNAIGKQLLDFQSAFGEHVEIFVTDAFGATVAATGHLTDYKQSDEEWWQMAWNDGRGAIYISNPEFDESVGADSILIAVPVTDQLTGDPVGVLRTTILVEGLYKALGQTKIGETGFAVLYDAEGNLLFDPNKDTEAAFALSDEVVKSLIKGAEEDNTGNFEVVEDENGDELLIGYSTFRPTEGGSQVNIDRSSTGEGFHSFCVTGSADIANASRQINSDEISACADLERTPIPFRVGTDAMVLAVSETNYFVDDVSTEELAAIFSTAETWADVNPDWPDVPILRYAPAINSDYFNYFVEVVMDGDNAGLLLSENTLFSTDSNVLAQGIISSPYAVGIIGYAYYLNYADLLNILSIDGISISSETIRVGTYPLARPLFLYSDATVMQAKPQVAAFLNYFLNNIDVVSEIRQTDIGEAGYFPVSIDELEKSRENWLTAMGEETWSVVDPQSTSGNIDIAGSTTLLYLVEEIADRFERASLQQEQTALLSDQASKIYDTVNKLGWTALVNQTTEEAFAQISAVIQTITVISIVIVILVAITSIGIAQLLTGPIVRLTKVAEDIAGGQLSATAKVETQDEIGVLARAFNNMTTQLRNLVDTLEHQVEDRTRALETSTEVSRRLSTILDQEQLVREVVEQLRSALGYYHAQIYLYDDRKKNLIMAGGTGDAGRTMLARGHKIESGRGLVGRAAKNNEVVLIPDVTQADGWLPNPLLPDTKAEVAVPISLGDEVLGVLDVQQNITNGLSKEDTTLIQSIANQVAIAIQNAQAYTQAQRQAVREAQASAINQRIQVANTIEDVLKIAVRELGQVLNAERADVELSMVEQTNGDSIASE